MSRGLIFLCVAMSPHIFGEPWRLFGGDPPKGMTEGKRTNSAGASCPLNLLPAEWCICAAASDEVILGPRTGAAQSLGSK